MSVITPEIVKQVALLARLRLEGEALSQLTGQLDEILQYVQQLQAIPTDQVQPTSHVLPLANVLRSDERGSCLPAETVAALAPAAHGAFVKVPKVVGA